jgi:hypothetical protein
MASMKWIDSQVPLIFFFLQRNRISVRERLDFYFLFSTELVSVEVPERGRGFQNQSFLWNVPTLLSNHLSSFVYINLLKV